MLALTVNIPAATAAEGSAAIASTVTRTGSLASALTVFLSSNDTTEATVPASVVIPATQASATFAVTPVDDNVADGVKTVTITADAAGHASGFDSIGIASDDFPALRPATASDVLNVRPGAQAGQFELTGGPAPIAAATPLPVVDLTTITAGDQRVSLDAPTSTPYSRAQGLVKVDLNQRYTLSAWALNTSEFNDSPLGFASYDVDKLEILPLHVQKYELAVDTTLAAALLPGATAFYLTNASGWSNDLAESGGTRALAWYGYRDSTGHTYADYTYTRNVASDFDRGLWAAGGIRYDDAAQAYRIDLLETWSGPALPAGAAVRNAADGETVNAPVAPVAHDFLEKYTQYAVTIGGGAWTGGNRNESLFRPGTAYIQPVTSPHSLAGRIVVGPEEDSIYGGASDPTKVVTETPAGSPVTLELDVLAKGALGGGASVQIQTAAAVHGTATIVPGVGPGDRAIVRYVAPAGFAGTDVVTYTLRNTANNATVMLTVRIHVLGGNLGTLGTVPTIVRDENFDTAPGLAMTGVLATASNVRLVDGPAHGTVKMNSDGSFVYTPEAGYVGLDVFHGEALTTTGPSSVTAFINVLASNDALVDARLRETGLAMLNYESSKRNFPLDDLPATNFDASGNPFLSWRVHILPFMGYQALYDQFRLNEPWNSTHNMPLASKMPDIFRTPGDAASSMSTRFQLISGEGEPYYLRRVSGRLTGPRVQEVTDGLSNTILVVESGANQAVTWTKPDDLEFVAGSPLSALGTLSGKIKAAMMDGAVRTFSSAIAPADFTALVTVSGGELVDAGTLAREYSAGAGLPTGGAAASVNALKQLALAMQNYEIAQGRYPVNVPASQRDAAGNPLLSWRVHILPYMEQMELYSRFKLDEPWNSPNNLPLLAEMPDVFRSVGDPATSTTTRMQTFYGAGAPFRPSTAVSQAGISDGHANTIMIMEVGANVAVPWTQPADVAFNPADPRSRLGTLSDLVPTAFFDSHVGLLPADLDAATWKALATHAGGEVVDAGTIEARERQRLGAFDRLGMEQNKYRQLIQAMHDFEDARARFPSNTFASDGTPLLSWRVHILPYLGYQNLFNKFRKDEPWNSAWNLALLDEMPDLFRAEGEAWDSYTTRAQTFVGPTASGAPFPSSGTNTTTGITQASITDGASNTFAIVKAGAGHGVPWTKPADILFDANNPFSMLGDVGPTILAAFFDGSVRHQNGAMSLGQLKAFITRNGGEDVNNPPPITPTPDINIHETGGDTRFSEFGADAFDLVLESPPTGDVTVTVAFDGSTGLATLDRTSLVFTPANWNKPQRVVVRGVDDHVVNSDRALLIQVGADGYLQKKNLPVRMLNDDLPALRGDFNSDSSVDGRDFLAWQRSAGMGWNATRSQGDADADTDVDHVDLAAWTVEFGGPAAPPSADFDGSGQVNSADLAAWRGGYGNAVNATPAAGDADLDHDVDGRDFLAWQRAFGGGGAAEAIAAASTANAAATAASGLNMLSGLPSLQGVAIPAHGGIAAARSMAQESAAKERDLAFGSLGDFVQEGDDGGRTDADAYQTNSLDEMRGSIDECLGEALDDDGVWRHFLPLA